MPHMSASVRTRAWAPAVALVLTAGIGAAGCGGGGGHGSKGDPSTTGPQGPKDAVRFVLGGGTGAAGSPGTETKVPGVLEAMAVGAHGTVALFTADAKGLVLWTTDAGGAAKSVAHPVTGLPAGSLYAPAGTVGHVAGQAAAAPDGSYYLALGRQGLWHVGSGGAAQRVVAGGANGPAVHPDGPASSFTADQVLGVAVGGDGAVYFSDYLSSPSIGFVHKLSGGQVTTVAGKQVRTQAEADAKGAGPTALDPADGAPARTVVLARRPNAGALAVNGKTLYVNTGDALISVSEAGLATPVVVNAPKDLQQPSLPYTPYGRSLTGQLATPYQGDPNRPAGIAYDDVSQALFFSTGAPVPALNGKDLHSGLGSGFDWKGDFTASQRAYATASRTNQFVGYDTEDGQLAGVLTDSSTLAVYDGHLYAANDTCGDGARACDPAKTATAVVRRAIPSM